RRAPRRQLLEEALDELALAEPGRARDEDVVAGPVELEPEAERVERVLLPDRLDERERAPHEPPDARGRAAPAQRARGERTGRGAGGHVVSEEFPGPASLALARGPRALRAGRRRRGR